MCMRFGRGQLDEVVGCAFLLELGSLGGAGKLAGLTRYSLLEC